MPLGSKSDKPQKPVKPVDSPDVAALIANIPDGDMKQAAPPEQPEALSPDLMNWLQGLTSSPPPDLSNMMADVSNKMGMFMAYILIKRLSSLNQLMQAADKIEGLLFHSNKYNKQTSEKDLREDYTIIMKNIENGVEMTRKFAAQSRELIQDPQRDELLQLLRSLDSDGLKTLRTVVEGNIKSRSVAGSLAKPGAAPNADDGI